MSDASVLARLRDVAMGYPGEPPILPPFDFEVPVGAFVGIVGPNGAGKTTLMRTICGVLAPRSGHVEFPQGAPRVGYVPQQQRLDGLFPVSVTEVVGFGMLPSLGLGSRLTEAHQERARQLLADLGIDDLADRSFRDLSGGQRQRVLLARAMACEPELLALDEPTAALDAVAALRFHARLEALHSDDRTIILISHDLARTASLADLLVIISRERQMVRAGPTTEIMTCEVLSEVFGADVHVEEHDCHYMVDFHLHDGTHPHHEGHSHG